MSNADVVVWSAAAISLVILLTAVVLGIYALRAATPSRAVVAHAISHTAASLGILAWLLMVPEFQRLFNEFGLELPGLTRAVLRLGALTRSYFAFIMVPLLFSLPGIDAFVFHELHYQKRTAYARAWSAAGSTVLALMFTLCAVGVIMPAKKLLEALS